MSPTKPAHKSDKPPTEGNPPSLKTCYTVEGHGDTTAHIRREGGRLVITQGSQTIRLLMSNSAALRMAIENLEADDTYTAFSISYASKETTT